MDGVREWPGTSAIHACGCAFACSWISAVSYCCRTCPIPGARSRDTDLVRWVSLAQSQKLSICFRCQCLDWLLLIECAVGGCRYRGCVLPNTTSLPFCDPELPTAARAKDLVSRMTLEEKKVQLIGGIGGGITPATPRLGVPAYQ